MRLEEIEQGNGAEQGVDSMKAIAKAAKDRAKQLKVQADMSSERLEMQNARKKLTDLQRQGMTSTIKPAA
jgi:hypothetical protein